MLYQIKTSLNPYSMDLVTLIPKLRCNRFCNFSYPSYQIVSMELNGGS